MQGTAGYDIRVDLVPMPADNCTSGPLPLDPSNLAGSETAYFTPDADVHATANVSVGVPDFLDVGVQGDVEVVRAHMPINESFALENDGGTPTFVLDMGGHLTADLMSGALSIYADLLLDRVDKEIVHWSGIPLDQHFGTTLKLPLPLMNAAFEKNH